MRAPNSRPPFRATSSCFVSHFPSALFVCLSIIVVLAQPASTRSVVAREIGITDHAIVIDAKPISRISLDDRQGTIVDDGSVNVESPISEKIVEKNDGKASEIGKSTVISELTGAKTLNEVTKNKPDEGIRRFDAIVVTDDAVDKNLGKSVDSETDKTVMKGIIVRDAPIAFDIDRERIDPVAEAVELDGFKVNRKRSLADRASAGETVESTKVEPSGVELTVVDVNDASEKIADFDEAAPVSGLDPVVSSSRFRTLALAENLGTVQDQLKDAVEEEIAEVVAQSIATPAKSVEPIVDNRESATKDEIVVLEPKTIIIYEDGVGKVDDKTEIGKDEVSMSRKSLPIFDAEDNDDEDDKRMVRSDEQHDLLKVNAKSAEIDETSIKQEVSKSPTTKNSHNSALSILMKTEEDLDALKAQALSMQEKIKDKDYLHDLQQRMTEILPGIPNFTEIQLLDALMTIVPAEKSENMAQTSHLREINSSVLNEDQVKIVQLAETLLARQQRPTFVENMMDCIISLSVLNCMKIFIWPMVADNLPESLTQTLPSLPIEIRPSDWLPANQQNIPKTEGSRSVTDHHHQQRLITPEVVVSGILTNALNADPSKIADSTTTHIDMKNETLSKWLTPGQLEILKMAEKFLPESSRSEYSNKMSSCVRRFEYFSCVKYFAWPMVKQHYPALPDFPDYQSWYPTVTIYPGYPILPYPNTEGIGELPEVVEADEVRTRSPRPEAVIVQILENVLRQTPGYLSYQQTYQARRPATGLSPITQDQMAIFYTAEQLIPVQLRADYMTKTMNCIRDYDYLTCTKYSTWPTVRQWWPSLPDFPDLSSLIPTFAVPELPDFSQYIPDFSSWLPNLPGTTPPQPEPETQPQPQPSPDSPTQEANVTIQSKAAPPSPIENRIIQILSNIRWIPLARIVEPVASVTPESLAVIRTLTYNQLRILGMAKNALPGPVRGDLDSRLVGCLQGGSDFISCTRNVIWPTLQFYVKDMPSFPDEEAKPEMQKLTQATYVPAALKPGVYQPIFNPNGAGQPIFSDDSVGVAGRSPLGGHITAEPEESVVPVSQGQDPGPQTSQDHPTGLDPTASLRQGASAKSNDPLLPIISVTDTRFTPIYSDHPEALLLKILATIQSSSKYADNSYGYEKPGSLEFQNVKLNKDQKSVIRVAESLLPDEVKLGFTDRTKTCLGKSTFVVCAREIVWPSLAPYYQRLPSFPNFYINDSIESSDAESLGIKNGIVPHGNPPISETAVKTGQLGDALLTITDTRFVPIFSQHPESVILTILNNVQATSPNLLGQTSSTKSVTRSAEFTASFTDQQGNIVTVAENLLPESIREVFTKRMTECVRENSFLACTRDIAWPTIAQFFPRLPNFPNIGDLTDYIVEKPQQRPALLPPHPEPVEPPRPQEDPSQASPIGNLIPITPEDVESRIEATLQQITARSKSIQRTLSFLNTKDPSIGNYVTERQAHIIQLCEDLLPYNAKPIFVGRMTDCARSGNVFPNCVREIGWPLLRQYVPDIPDLPDFGTYFPQLPQELPQIPQFPDYQLPQIQPIPGFDGFQLAGQGFPLRTQHEKIGHEGLPLMTSLHPQSQPLILSGIQGLTPSVESVDSGASGSSGLSPSVVQKFPAQSIRLLNQLPSTMRRQRRHINDNESTTSSNKTVSTDSIESLLRPNITESEFLGILVNVTKKNVNASENAAEKFPNGLNSTILNSLTPEQLAIIKIVENISSQTGKGVMSQVFQCIRSLSVMRCVGIFVWPVITQNMPSIPSIPGLSLFNPFGRGSDEKDSFEHIFGMSSDEFESELLEKKKNVEDFLKSWYHEIVEKKYDNDFGFMRVRGYGDGEIGISFDGFERKSRGAKLKDSKNMPSILTIISDIMEDVLEQRDAKTDKRDHGKRDRSFREKANDYNGVVDDADRPTNSERSTNDDRIIAMFIDKIKSNASEIEEIGKTEDHHYSRLQDAYEAFELLFGTRLGEKMADKLRDLDENRYEIVGNDSQMPKKIWKTFVRGLEDVEDASRVIVDEEQSVENGDGEEGSKERNLSSDLIVRLPKIDREFVSRKVTNDLADFGRKMKMEMSQFVPGLSFLISFFVQMALAHARAAASVAGMMSNMALGSAMFSMIRQSLFGSGESNVKHVYDNSAMGPGITWPHHNHHG